MAGVDVGTAYLTVVPSARGFAGNLQKELGGGMDAAGKSAGADAAKGFHSSFTSGVGNAAKAGALALAGIAAGGIAFARDAIAEARDSQKVGAITTQVIKTTGGAAKVTADQVGNLATAISNKTGIDDEAIQSGANLLLTFKNVKNEVGDGANIFDRATQAATDLSAAGFGDMATTSKQLGKALNDPIAGISALSRSGVTFTDQQKEQIKTLVASGKTLDAQKIILKEVESQVGGTAAASATSGEKLATAFGNFKEQIGTALLPVIDKVETFLTEKAIPAVSNFFQEMQDGSGTGGQVAKVIGEIVDKVKNFITEFQNGEGAGGKFRDVLSGVATAAQSTAKFIGDNATVFQALGAALLTGISVFKTISTVARIYTGVQAALNVVLAANPIGLIVIAVAALAAGLIYAYQNSETFRNVVDTAFKAIGAAASFMWHTVVAPIIRLLLLGFAAVTDNIGNMLDALSNIPGFGWAKTAADKMHGAANKAQELADNINGIPDQKTIKVRTEFVTVGNPPPLPVNSPAFFESKWLKPAGMRAGGGPVSAGRSYIVGEHEPELFVPNTSGRIMNQSQIAAANDPQVLARAIATEMVRALQKAPAPQVAISQVDGALGWRT